jgi:hypothetical protein
MNPNDKSADASKAVASTRRVELVVAAIFLLLGVVVAFESRKLGAGWSSDGPGAGYFPFYIGLIIILSSIGTMVQTVWGKSGKDDAKDEVFVDREQLERVLSVLLPAMAYVVAVQFLGLYVASAIYIALFMVILGKYSWIKSVIAALAVNTLFFLMFEVWFKVPLFKGSLDPLHFLGY